MAQVKRQYNFLDAPQHCELNRPNAKRDLPETHSPLLSTLLVCEWLPHAFFCQDCDLAVTSAFCLSFTIHIKNTQLINFTL